MNRILLVVIGLATLVAAIPSAAALKWIPMKNPSLFTVNEQSQLDEQTRDWSFKVDENWRLPRNLVPVSYNVRLLPFIEVGNFTTDGYVEMVVRCVQSTSSITFSSADITIDRLSVTVVTNDTNQAVNVVDITEDVAYEKVTIRTTSALTEGTVYKISMKFVSILNDQLRGFYRSSYILNGETKYLAVTHFEAPNARRAFPCFDEPSMKAVFQITLGRKEFMSAVANMPLKETIPMDGVPGYVWDVFETSIKMSTYTVAFIVSEFSYVEPDPALSSVKYRVWGRPDRREQMEYASIAAPVATEFLESYFGIDFPIIKLDMAAIPDFPAGAMENWGFITYMESFLYYDPKKTTVNAKELITEVISHELVHQWTGNLVTMEWWNDTWLNEGSARYFQYRTADSVNPGFGLFEQFPVKAMHPVMLTDSVPTSRPVSFPVSSPEEIGAMFDSITYDKGACIMRMMANFMGDDTFTRAMNLYLTRKAYSNANQDEFFQAMNDQMIIEGLSLPASIKAIMDTWTLQMGFPVVNITRDYQTGAITFEQERFLRVPIGNISDPNVYLWWIPLSYMTINSESRTFIWMPNVPFMTVNSLDASINQWLLFNIDQKGYYRVLYDSVNYALLRDQLIANHTIIPVLNRGHLLDDAFNLALVDMVPYTVALDLTLYLEQERRYSPWHAVLPELDYLNSMFLNNAIYGDWKRYMTKLVTPFFNYLGFEESPTDPHLTILSRSDAMNWACRLGVAECTQKATLQYAAWMSSSADVEVISRHQKSIVLCAGVENGSEADWQYAYQRFLNPLDASENSAILSAMGCTKFTSLHTRMLDMMLDSSSGIAGQNGINLFSSVSNNPLGNALAFDFLRTKFNQLTLAYPASMPGLFRTVSTRYNTPLQRTQLLELRDQYSNILGNSAIVNQAIARVEANIKWMDLNSAAISNWLKEH